ncbi:MAG: glycosyltransferase [Pseudomonadota bacterium]
MTFSISVPIGAYHPFLRHNLASLAAQITDANGVELAIAFLDASGDNRVREIADEFDSMLAYRRHGPDGGQSDAIVEGWNNCPGDILGWLNADDILFPGALSKAAAAFSANPAIDVVYGHSIIIDDDFRATGYHWAVEPPGPRLLEAGIISQPSCFFRRSAYERAGGLDCDLHYTMDWELWIKLFKSGAQFEFIEDVLSLVLWSDDTKTSSFNQQRRDEINAIIRSNLDERSSRRVFRSFAVHHVLEKIRPKPLRRFISRQLVRGRNAINGISGDGMIQDGAFLKLVHYEQKPARSALIKLDNPASIDNVSAVGATVSSVTRSDDTISLQFEEPVTPATTLELCFSTNEHKAPYLHSAEWK